MPALLERGALDLSWLSARGQPIGALYNLVWNDKVYYYLPQFPHAAAIRRAIAGGHREYDFLAGAQRFKRQLSLAERPMVELRAARPSARRTALALARRGARAVRSRTRRPSTA